MSRKAEFRLAQGETVGAICRSLGISEQSCYRRRREYGGLKVSQARRFSPILFQRPRRPLRSFRRCEWSGRRATARRAVDAGAPIHPLPLI
ncbi:MAG: transposase [Parasphingopyxis sp.]